MMRIVLLILAVVGIAAVLRHLATALLRLLRRGVDAFMADQVADVRARRGDLTGLSDAEVVRSQARRSRLAAVGTVSLWTALLVVPPLTSWPELVYACYNVLWLVPPRRRR
ncbi:MAG: hypothetical protein ACRELX_02600 [Longimicrobiales bacterium]